MNAQAATATPQTTSGGFPSMQVVRALAAAAQRVREVECAGKSLDPRDPYAYARADDLVAAAKEALSAEGLLVLPASSDEKPEPVTPSLSVIWLRQTFNVVHVESGEWLPFQADPWPLHRDKPLDKAMATAKTASKAYFYLSLLEIRRVGPNAEDMDADVPPEAAPAASKPVTDSTAIGVSSRSKQSAAGARMSRQNEERNRERVDPEKLADELAKEAESAFSEGSSGLSVCATCKEPIPTGHERVFTKDGREWHVACEPRIKDSVASNPVSPSVGAVPAEGPPTDSGNSDTSSEAACKSGPESTPSATSTDGATNTTSGAGESLPPSSSSPAPEGLTEADWAPDSRLVPMIQGPGDSSGTATLTIGPVLAKRVAESRAGKWTRSVERKARQAFWCLECQPDLVGTLGGEDKRAIQPKAKHRDGSAGRCCLKCYERLMAEAEPVKEGA